MGQPINSFTPNTDARRAAEVLVGMEGMGHIRGWRYDDPEFVVILAASTGEITEHSGTPRDILWMARGVLAVMANAVDQLEVDADGPE